MDYQEQLHWAKSAIGIQKHQKIEVKTKGAIAESKMKVWVVAFDHYLSIWYFE